MFKGKKYKASEALIDKSKAYDPTEAIALVCETSKAKFDETIEVQATILDATAVFGQAIICAFLNCSKYFLHCESACSCE